jgi:hypothetical protein
MILLLEAGVLLVSVKLIIMVYHNSFHVKKIEEKFEELKELILKSRSQ